MVENWIKDLVKGICGEAKMSIGAILDHPGGYKVKITGGRYWGVHGISNFWYWKKIFKNGKESKNTYSGYGWC